MTSGQRLKTVRLDAGLTQDQFGHEIGLKKSVISQIENDSALLTVRTARAVSRSFGVNEQWLLTGEGEMRDDTSREEEISSFFRNAIQGGEDFKVRFIEMLTKLTPDEWQLLEDMANRLQAEEESGPQ